MELAILLLVIALGYSVYLGYIIVDSLRDIRRLKRLNEEMEAIINGQAPLPPVPSPRD